jgi:hypothetical protein
VGPTGHARRKARLDLRHQRRLAAGGGQHPFGYYSHRSAALKAPYLMSIPELMIWLVLLAGGATSAAMFHHFWRQVRLSARP